MNFKAYSWNAVRIGLGLLLLVAAGLKLAGQGFSAIPQIGWFATPTIQIAAAEWEIVLGIWLLSGAYRIGAWFASVATFFTLAAVSGYLGWIGVASCGCFGAIKASPWHAFEVDLFALLLVAVLRPDFSSAVHMPKSELGRLALVGAGTGFVVIMMLATIVGVGKLAFGSPGAALARLQGDVLTTDGSDVDFGVGKPGEWLDKTVEVRNWTVKPVRLTGGSSDCLCVATDGLPVTIPPSGARKVPVRMRVQPSASGSVSRSVVVWTDCDQQREIRLVFSCRVEDP